MAKSSFGYKSDVCVCIYFHNEPLKHRIQFILRAKNNHFKQMK